MPQASFTDTACVGEQAQCFPTSTNIHRQPIANVCLLQRCSIRCRRDGCLCLLLGRRSSRKDAASVCVYSLHHGSTENNSCTLRQQLLYTGTSELKNYGADARPTRCEAQQIVPSTHAYGSTPTHANALKQSQWRPASHAIFCTQPAK